jgi:hypothetical protein
VMRKLMIEVDEGLFVISDTSTAPTLNARVTGLAQGDMCFAMANVDSTGAGTDSVAPLCDRRGSSKKSPAEAGPLSTP